jgi:hypothetical protein
MPAPQSSSANIAAAYRLRWELFLTQPRARLLISSFKEVTDVLLELLPDAVLRCILSPA